MTPARQPFGLLKPALAALAPQRSARRVLASHPWTIGLMESRISPGPANLRHREALPQRSAAALVAAGYDPAEEFIFGLDLILDALEPLRASA